MTGITCTRSVSVQAKPTVQVYIKSIPVKAERVTEDNQPRQVEAAGPANIRTNEKP